MDENQNPSMSFPVELNSLNTSIYLLTEALSTGISLDNLKLYVKYPMKYNKQLRDLTRQMYSLNGVFTNVVDYYVSSPSLDSITMCFENTKKNQKKKKSFDLMLEKLNHKLTTRDILLHLFLDGMYVGILRNTPNKDVPLDDVTFDTLAKLDALNENGNLMIQPLDLDYIRFRGFANNDYVIEFNMQYFDQFMSNGLSNEIRNYPNDFIKAYLIYKKDGSKKWHRLEQKTTVALKFKSNIKEPYGRTLATAALSDMVFSEQYTDSQRATISDLASSIYYLILPEGEKKGSCSLNKDQQTNIINAFEGAVSTNSNNKMGQAKVSKLTLAPGTQIDKLTKDTTLLKDTLSDENIKRVSTSLGFASGALNGEGNATYSSLQVNIDLILTQIYQILEQVNWQYSKVFNNLIGAKSKDMIKFMYLKTSALNKKEEFDIAKDMFTNAGGSRIWMYAVGSGDVNTYMSLMDYEKSVNMDEMYPPHMTSYTMSDEEGDGGRPEGNASNGNTNKSKTNGSNNQPKPSTK